MLKVISRLKPNKSRNNPYKGGITISQVNKLLVFEIEPMLFVLLILALNLVYKWITVKNLAMKERGIY